jgi:FAD/FMN-containing dehydrogenase/Fe-S oxidoreductase
MALSEEFVAELHRHFRGEFRLDKASRVMYSTDASIYQVEPLGVVIPSTQEDLIAAVELAAKYKIPILPRGSGSSLAGQAIGQALILDCSRYLDSIPVGGIDPENRTATVEPGVILTNLNRAAAKYGLMFGPDPASAERATMGGVIGNNATGAHSISYGMTADQIVTAQVILSDGSLATWGPVEAKPFFANNRQSDILEAAFEIRERYAAEIMKAWPHTWRNSAGYRLNYLLPWSASQPPQWVGAEYPPEADKGAFNLATLLAGSEGTLAVIRSATVRLVPKPKYTVLGVLAYGSIVSSCDAVPALMEHHPSAVELIPRMLIQLAGSVPAYGSRLSFVRGDPAALLVVEFSGDDPDVLLEKVKGLSPEVIVAESMEDQANIWSVRKMGLGILNSAPAAARPVAFIEDCAIPVERLGDFVREVERILESHGTRAAFYAHASAGCLHIRPIINLKTAVGVHDLRSIAQDVLKLTLSVGGAMSSEHGDGMLRAEWLNQTYGKQIIEAMKSIKRVADPDALLNPGKMVSAPAMDTNLRYGTAYKSGAWTPVLDFNRAGGLSGAIEQCNGQGVCRKFDGVMCPSFQATRDEKHSTRGRANLLRALISAGGGELRDEQVREAMDLCLACKGCKAECPSSVDMAKLKYEFQHHYFESHPRPWRDYLFGYIGTFAQLGAPLGILMNAGTSNGLVKRFFNQVLGISEKRTFPKFGSRRRIQPYTPVPTQAGSNPRPVMEQCLFLPDIFTHFFEPEVETAALKVLAACGIEAKILPVYGAGRTLLSKGFIEPAKRHALKLLREIQRADPSGKLAVVGLEPSEIYILRDELLEFLPEKREEVDKLMGRAWLIDEFLIRPAESGGNMRVAALNIAMDQNTNPGIVLHGHCYQKAQPPHADGLPVGINATKKLLSAVGYNVDVLDTGCCGMAGAFGYESDHYDISMQVGELKLFPGLRERNSHGVVNVAAPGTSCRAQIQDGTGITARHSIMWVARKSNL